MKWALAAAFVPPQALAAIRIAGGSSLTGLRNILLNPQSLPKTILSSRIFFPMSRTRRLLENLQLRDTIHSFFSPVRMAVAAYENWCHAPADRTHSSAYAHQLLQGRLKNTTAKCIWIGWRKDTARMQPLLSTGTWISLPNWCPPPGLWARGCCCLNYHMQTSWIKLRSFRIRGASCQSFLGTRMNATFDDCTKRSAMAGWSAFR